MQIILLSGGSGKRLWPLSNGTRSKQFLKLLKSPDGGRESMVQRIVRQLRAGCPDADITVATSATQRDAVVSQLGDGISVVTEPERRETFPAISLAVKWLLCEKHISPHEVVVVVPCDTFADDEYFSLIKRLPDTLNNSEVPLALIGVNATAAVTDFGYLLPEQDNPSYVQQFVEKPTKSQAVELLKCGACWNGGVFAFRAAFIKDIVDKFVDTDSFVEFRRRYAELPRISFDREVAEKVQHPRMIRYHGLWKDLGTWETLSAEMAESNVGKVEQTQCSGTTALNELNIPMVCHGVHNLIVAASPDGILVADKHSADSILEVVESKDERPMYEERRWGTYRVIDNVTFPDGFCALTKQLTLNPGCSISYQKHTYRDEVWTFIDGKGEIVLDGERYGVRRGDVIVITRGQMHALRALTSLTFIEVQRGKNLVEEDIERFPYSW